MTTEMEKGQMEREGLMPFLKTLWETASMI